MISQGDEVKYISRILAAYLLAIASGCASAEIIFFENVNVIPMSDERVLKNQRVIVNDDKIAAVESMSVVERIEPDRRVDCQNKYLMPGFADVHFHPRGATSEKEHELLYKLLLANGITTVVSMGEDAGQDAIAIKQFGCVTLQQRVRRIGHVARCNYGVSVIILAPCIAFYKAFNRKS